MEKDIGSTFIERSLKNREDPAEDALVKIKTTTFKSVFCSKISKGIFVAVFIAITLPILGYYLIISLNLPSDYEEQYSCLIKDEFRISCGNPGVSQKQCEDAYCCYNITTNQCYHYLPSKYFYAPNDDGSYSPSQTSSPVGSTSVQNLKFTIQNKTPKKVSLIIHENSEDSALNSLNGPNFFLTQSEKKLVLDIYDSEGDSLLSTAKGALIASKYHWEWSFQLSNGTLFGLDRNVIKLNKNETLTKVIYKNKEDHSSLPVFWVYVNGKFFGLVIRHDGPLEIQVLSSNIVILRSLLGKKIEVELTLGPSPTELYQEQVEDKVVPPLWSLGTHYCRKGNTIDLSEILEIYSSDTDSKFDTDCVHENLFLALQNSKTSEENITALKSYITTLAADKKFLLSLPPHILIDDKNLLYQTIKDLNLLYKYQSGIVYNGTYLNQKVVYPDYSNTSISNFIQIMLDWIDAKIGLKNIHGFVLNDNWPQDDSYNNIEKIDFPYYTEAIDTQMKHTLPWTLQGTDEVLHLEKHNSYGSYQHASLFEYLKTVNNSEARLIISSTKRYGNTEPQILQNFETSWENFQLYLSKIMFGSITGNTMLGLPVCGDTVNYNNTLQEVLCMRWYIAAATMPYFRVSSVELYRNPGNLNSDYASRISVAAMEKRALLQDYYFTILNKKEPLIRPMYFNYYDDPSTLSLERQYTIGKDIILVHPFSSGRVKLQVYLPLERGVWYEFWGGTMFKIENYEEVNIDSFESDWTMFISQGSIAALTDANKIYLYIALDCTNAQDTQDCTATGDLFKDGNSLQFSATNITVTISGLPSDCSYTLGLLKVYGYLGNTSYSIKYDKHDLALCTSMNVTINYVDE